MLANMQRFQESTQLLHYTQCTNSAGLIHQNTFLTLNSRVMENTGDLLSQYNSHTFTHT